MNRSGTNTNEVMDQLKSLIGESNSMAERIREYEHLLRVRDQEIELLQQMVEDAHVLRSTLENQLQELRDLQQHFNELSEITAASKRINSTAHTPIQSKQHYEEQIDRLKEHNTLLQVQLDDLQDRYRDMNRQCNELQQFIRNSGLAPQEDYPR